MRKFLFGTKSLGAHMSVNTPAVAMSAFAMDALPLGSVIIIDGVTESGEVVQSELVRLARSSEGECKEGIVVRDNDGNIVDYLEKNHFTGDTTPVTMFYFAHGDRMTEEVRVSATLMETLRFFDGHRWITVQNYEIRR